MKKLVSVIIPVYNAQEYLDRCLESVVNQTYNNIEIILIDDGSTDSSSFMCDCWAQKDSRVDVTHIDNSGAGYARNIGLEKAKGDYILFVDSDDYIDHKTVEICVDSFEKENVDTVLFSLYNVYPDSTKKPASVMQAQKSFFGAQLKEELLTSLFVHTLGYGVSVWGKMFSADVIKKNNIHFQSEREYYSEDALFVLEYFSVARGACALNQHLYYYFENTQSLSRNYKEDRENRIDNYLLKSVEIAKANNLPQTVESYICARYHGCVMSKLKQIFVSQLPVKRKHQLLRAEYKNKVLRTTLKKRVFDVEKHSLVLFYRLLKLRLYCLCDLLLWYRVKK